MLIVFLDRGQVHARLRRRWEECSPLTLGMWELTGQLLEGRGYVFDTVVTLQRYGEGSLVCR